MRIDCGLCVIREWQTRDAEELISAANNRKIWLNLQDRFPHPYTDADASSWFSHLQTTSEPSQWAIEVDGVAAGGIGVDLGEDIFVKTGHFGYWLGEHFWGRGIMSVAVRIASQYCLNQYNLERLEAPVFSWNPASMRVLEKAGFVREAVLHKSAYKDGQLIDQVLYTLLRQREIRLSGLE
ncbi:GNAT family N-acetyltransferase [Azonexus sp.]|uniref:GNAT family N-acetyltransferase n=1 Tax=Azonexus sp. TaxID=1872668 RepID=UPI0027B9EB46|nr:GNAT family protein [Azonexus sp.]